MRWKLLTIAVLVVGAGLAWGTLRIRQPDGVQKATGSAAAVEKFCATCHALPPPNAYPQAVWPQKINQMYQLAGSTPKWPKSKIPSISECVRYYMTRAPRQMGLPVSQPVENSHLNFTKVPVHLGYEQAHPGTGNLQFVRINGGEIQLLLCDMARGYVAAWDPATQKSTILGKAGHPCHAEVVDLDQDGADDVLVANLGVTSVQDTDKGSVVWLRATKGGKYDAIQLWGGLGRVADVQARDFDGDGDLDVIAGVFGYRATGFLMYLQNISKGSQALTFEPSVIDGRPGFIHTPPVDLNGDKHPDVIGLIAQEHEKVEAYLNDGRANFSRQNIFSAPQPSWGSSGVELVDFDGDGDTDVLMTNGDSFDVPPMLKPYHGVAWLENTGGFPFTFHPIGAAPGVHHAKAGDVDNDGDLDVVACVFAAWVTPSMPESRFVDSLVVFEQTANKEFRRHLLERGNLTHPSLDLVDYDDDGDLDIAVANFSFGEWGDQSSTPAAMVYRNDLSAE